MPNHRCVVETSSLGIQFLFKLRPVRSEKLVILHVFIRISADIQLFHQCSFKFIPAKAGVGIFKVQI